MKKRKKAPIHADHTVAKKERSRLEAQLAFNRSEDAKKIDEQILAALERGRLEEEAFRQEHNLT